MGYIWKGLHSDLFTDMFYYSVSILLDAHYLYVYAALYNTIHALFYLIRTQLRAIRFSIFPL